MESRAVIILTFLVVLLLSPLSFVLALPVGITPDVWLGFWLKYVLFFIIAAFACAVLGLSIALHISTKKKF
jgi:hypothetical protein